MRSRHIILIAPSNARVETPAQEATPKPKPTWGGDLGVCTQPTPQPPPPGLKPPPKGPRRNPSPPGVVTWAFIPNPRPITHILIYPKFTVKFDFYHI
ncbi:hypothetical protein HanRHA438_Chr12g0566191 [Helianthus annuus]|nr:hypothetical protein HanRHA438_Chr12g0566191 [Helianthus annuus]